MNCQSHQSGIETSFVYLCLFRYKAANRTNLELKLQQLLKY